MLPYLEKGFADVCDYIKALELERLSQSDNLYPLCPCKGDAEGVLTHREGDMKME